MWLKHIERAGSDRKLRLASAWELFNYKHPPPRQTTVEQQHEFTELESWRRVVAFVPLDNHWVQTFFQHGN